MNSITELTSLETQEVAGGSIYSFLKWVTQPFVDDLRQQIWRANPFMACDL